MEEKSGGEERERAKGEKGGSEVGGEAVKSSTRKLPRIEPINSSSHQAAIS